uniref:VanW family protein n=1 Tax=Faecousia sp. TaxID=2952921 RepID=UPI004025E9F8
MEKEPHVFEEDDEAFLRSLNALLEELEPQETQPPQDAPMPKKPQVGKKKMPPKTGGFWKKLGIGTAIAAAVALACALGIPAVTRIMDPYNGQIVSDVSVGGVEIGGLTKGEAKKALQAAFGEQFSQKTMEIRFSEAGTVLEKLNIRYPANSLLISPEESHAKLDAAAAVKAAYALGRTDLDGSRTMSLLPYLGLDEAAIRSVADSYAQQLAQLYQDSSYTIQGTAPDVTNYNESTPCQTVTLFRGYPGIEIDADALYNEILEGYNTGSFAVSYQGTVSAKKPVSPDLDGLWKQTRLAPENPSVDLTSYQVIPGVHGYEFDLAEAKQQFQNLAYGESTLISLHYTDPEIADEDAYFQDVLGHCETPHGDNENRNGNLRKACGMLDGLVLQPGQELSYNEALGPRTKELGWLPAPAYSGTKLVDSPGGGICQVSSTLYLASVYSELTIVERRNHGYPVSYIPLGMDATVSWGFADLKIRNDSPMPVKIQAEESDGYVRISILGTETRNYNVEMSYTVGGRYVRTYMSKIDKETGEVISKEPYALSGYMDDIY